MNSRERVFYRLSGKPVDKIPNLNIVMGLAAKKAGVGYGEYASDYRKLAEGNLICAQLFGIDAVSVISDPMREASAFGAVVEIPGDAVPFSPVPLLEHPVELKKLKIFDPFESERTLDRIKAVEYLRGKVLNDYPVIGWVEGVLAEAADLRGVENLMMDLADDAPYLSDLFDIIFSQQCRFAKAQIDTGADIIGIGNAVASLIGPKFYERYAMNYDKKLVSYIKKYGAKTKLHICGDTTLLIDKIRNIVKPDIFDIDWMVDFSSTVEVCKESITAVNGNMDPVGVMLQGDLKTVETATLFCVQSCDINTTISAGCEIPAETSETNLIYMDKLLYL